MCLSCLTIAKTLSFAKKILEFDEFVSLLSIRPNKVDTNLLVVHNVMQHKYIYLSKFIAHNQNFYVYERIIIR